MGGNSKHQGRTDTWRTTSTPPMCWHLGALGVLWVLWRALDGHERTFAHDAELRARAIPTSRIGRREQASGSYTWSCTSRSSEVRPKVILRAHIAAVLFRPAWRVPPVLSSEARSKAQGRAARSLGRGGQAGARPGTHERGCALVQVLAHRMRENDPIRLRAAQQQGKT